MPAAPVRRRGPAHPGDPPHPRQQYPVLTRDDRVRAASGERRPVRAVATARQCTRGRTTGSGATSTADNSGTTVTPPWDL
ncbi:hypothetical protein [Streptomyces virginiae]|uniref:Uncharacterized protein n=1 Tax=Streptomyces virginiae TaxID=1961 RepID=A0ABZ1TQV4_STRVG|nr:hypothetical protein [Streptomyces virginiae]